MFKVLTLFCAVIGGSQVALVAKNLPFNTGDVRYMNSICRSGRSPGEGHGNPHQYSCLESPWTEEPGRLQSIGSHRVRHYWSDLAHAVIRKRIRAKLEPSPARGGALASSPISAKCRDEAVGGNQAALSTQLWLRWPSSSALLHSWVPARKPTNSSQTTDK